MKTAIVLLNRSLSTKGKNEELVQFSTTRKTRSYVANAEQAGVGGLKNRVGAYERNKMWISSVETNSFWFTRFVEGHQKRVGEVIKQDKPITVEVLKRALEILEKEFFLVSTVWERKKIAEMGTWLSAGFCSGLRGEEMILIENNATLASIVNLKDINVPYYKLVIQGRTKGSQAGGSKFAIPIAGVTEGSNINTGIWIKRLHEVKAELGIKGGRLFSRKCKVPKLSEFEEDFFLILEKVQELGYIAKSVDVREEYGIARSTRRGVTTHALNVGVEEKYINAVNRWRKEKDAIGSVAKSLGMLGVYTKLDELTPYVLRYSRAL